MTTRFPIVAAGALAATLGGCSRAAPESVTLQGECAAVFTSQVCTWATLDGAGQLAGYGVTVPMATIDSAPEHVEMA